jgi:uncharacterized protein (TIGR02996 family)
VVPTKHPDATAFAARFLAQPDDRLGRVVFADWLEEQGGESNTAWADYIRTQAELETLAWNDPALGALSERAEAAGRRVRAKLILPAPRPQRLPELLKLLPANRCVLRFNDYWDEPSGRDWLPRSEADTHRLLPLYADERDMFLATRHPADVRLHERLTVTLNANVHLFGTPDPISDDEIGWTYSCTGMMWGPLDPAWCEVPIEAEGVRAVDALLTEVINARVHNVLVSGTHAGGRFVYKTAGGWRSGERLTTDQLRLLLGGVRDKLGGGAIPLFPRSAEFTHTHGDRTYWARGHLSGTHPGPRFWFSLTPLDPGIGVAR